MINYSKIIKINEWKELGSGPIPKAIAKISKKDFTEIPLKNYQAQ